MSKTEKTAKAPVSSPLRNDLVQALKALQTVTTSLGKYEESFIECEAAVKNERTLKNEISALQKEAIQLRVLHAAVVQELEQETANFADACSKLAREYDSRTDKAKKETSALVGNSNAKIDSLEKKWQQNLEAQKLETRRAKGEVSGLRRELEEVSRKASDAQRKSEESYSERISQCKDRITELSSVNEEMVKDLIQHEVMRNGRDTEILRLKGRLASLEAFEPNDSNDEVVKVVVYLYQKVRDFCVKCVEASNPLPGWNQLPGAIRSPYLPGLYRDDSSAGRYVLTAALQHSLSSAIKENVFIPFIPCASQESQEVARALQRESRSRAALWRLMTFNVAATDQELANASKAKLQKMSVSLLESWEPLLAADDIKALQVEATALFVDCASKWCDLMRIQDQLNVDYDLKSQCFDSDSEEESYTIPADLKVPDSTSPVLCLFPAFSRTVKSESTSQPIIIRKGIAMFRDSPPLILAWNEAQEVSSPRAAHRKTAR